MAHTTWKQIEGFGYEVSNNGQVKNSSTGHILKPYNNGTGYLKVSLMKNGKVNRLYVHRLVAQAFVDGYSEENNTVDHIDANRQNNTASNLQWMSLEANVKKAHEMNKTA